MRRKWNQRHPSSAPAQNLTLPGACVWATLDPMHTPLSDEALMLNYREGDLAAFTELYRRHRLGLYRFIAWRSPRQEWVDEIAQDCWAGLHGARAGYRPQAGFRTYLYQIARNRLIDLLRQKQIVLASELGSSGEMDTCFQNLADASQQAESSEQILEKKQRLSSLRAAIQTLPNEQKEALILQQFSEMSLEEIADVTAVSVETVKSRLRYAMQKLRSQLHNLNAQGELA